MAFVVSLTQNIPLIGEHGLEPVCDYMDSIRTRFADLTTCGLFLRSPTILWWLGCTDSTLSAVASAGALVSSWVVLTGRANAVIMSSLWVLYHALVNVGQTWFSFGTVRFPLPFPRCV